MYYQLNFTLTNFTGFRGTYTVRKRQELLLLVSVWLNFSLLLCQIIRYINWVELVNHVCRIVLIKSKPNNFLHQYITSMKSMFTHTYYSLLVQI